MIVITDLVKDFELDVSCTIKFHVIIIHVREHLEFKIKLRPESPRGLGSVSTQTPESMHHCFEKYVERFHPPWNYPKLLVGELYSSTASHAAKNLWPVCAVCDTEKIKFEKIDDFICKKNIYRNMYGKKWQKIHP